MEVATERSSSPPIPFIGLGQIKGRSWNLLKHGSLKGDPWAWASPLRRDCCSAGGGIMRLVLQSVRIATEWNQGQLLEETAIGTGNNPAEASPFSLLWPCSLCPAPSIGRPYEEPLAKQKRSLSPSLSITEPM